MRSAAERCAEAGRDESACGGGSSPKRRGRAPRQLVLLPHDHRTKEVSDGSHLQDHRHKATRLRSRRRRRNRRRHHAWEGYCPRLGHLCQRSRCGGLCCHRWQRHGDRGRRRRRPPARAIDDIRYGVFAVAERDSISVASVRFVAVAVAGPAKKFYGDSSLAMPVFGSSCRARTTADAADIATICICCNVLPVGEPDLSTPHPSATTVYYLSCRSDVNPRRRANNPVSHSFPCHSRRGYWGGGSARLQQLASVNGTVAAVH